MRPYEVRCLLRGARCQTIQNRWSFVEGCIIRDRITLSKENSDWSDLYDMPSVFMQPLPGIDIGIEGSDMPYVAWWLLNEACRCALNHTHFAAIICLAASVEVCLRRETKLDETAPFAKVIKTAEERGIISPQEAKMLQDLRETRNQFVHFRIDKLPRVSTIRRIGFSADMKIKRGLDMVPYPSREYEDLVPLQFAAIIAAKYAREVLAVLKRLYPRRSSDNQPPYYQPRNIKILDLMRAHGKASTVSDRIFSFFKNLVKHDGAR